MAAGVRPAGAEVEGPPVGGPFDRRSRRRPCCEGAPARHERMAQAAPTRSRYATHHARSPGAAGDLAPEGAVDAAVLRSAVALQHEIAAADLGTAMRRVAERTRALTGASAAHVTMLDGDELVTGATDGPADLRLPDRFRTPRPRSRGWRSAPASPSSASTPRPTSAPTPRSPARSGSAPSPSSRSCTRGATIGLLIVSGREPGTFVSGDVVNLELLSIVLSTAIAHAAERDAQREQRRNSRAPRAHRRDPARHRRGRRRPRGRHDAHRRALDGR